MFCAESAMIQTPGYLSSAALVSVGARSNYIASAAHYEAVARRIVAALRDGDRPMVLVTGEPPADPEVLSEALGNVAGPGYAVVVISCGPELKPADLERAVPKLAKPKTSGVGAEPGRAAPASPLFIFDDFDRLSDGQIQDVYQGAQRRGQIQWAAVLLAPLDFPARLERPALRFLKERIAAQFRFQEVADDEAIANLHNQLLAQRDRRVQARGFRHGILIGAAAGGVAVGASIGGFMLHSTAERVCETPASAGQSPLNEKLSMLQPVEQAATSAAPAQAAPHAATTSVIATARPPISAPPSPPPKVEDQSPLAAPSVAETSAGPRLSATEITALLERGDAFLGTGDITSARNFYERAAAADSGLAALQLGATFDPIVLGRAGIRGLTADPVQALFWYRRARELGAGDAEQRIKALETRPPGEMDTRSR
jgi:hypothetical protein